MKEESWKNLLNPESLKSNLIMSSMYITAFELLKNTIESYPKNFYIDGFSEKTLQNDEYKTQVLSLNKSPVYASFEWFRKLDAISQKDIKTFDKLKNYRNKLAHEMTHIILEGVDVEEYSRLFSSLIDLFNKIDRWWIINIELAIDPDIDYENADLEESLSSEVLMLTIMFEIIALDGEDSWKYYDSLFNKGDS